MNQTKEVKTNYKGGIASYESVKSQIAQRWPGEEVNYRPESNCASYKFWRDKNFYIIPGEKALQSVVVIERKDKTGRVVSKYPKRISLFYHLQVRPLGK